MNKAEKWLIAKAINRYLNEVEKENIFKNRILPLIQDFAGKKTRNILEDIKELFLDWVGEIDEFIKTL